MKTCFAVVLLFCFTHLGAQEFSKDHPFLFGGSAGLSYVNLSEISVTVNGQTSVAEKTVNRPVFGVFFEYRVNRKLGIGLECTYGYNRWDLEYGSPTNSFKEIHTYFRLRILPNLNLYYMDKKMGATRHYLFSTFGIGYRWANYEVQTNDPNLQFAYDVSEPLFEIPISTKVSIAYGIDVNDFWFTKFEFAFGGPFLNLGTGIRF